MNPSDRPSHFITQDFLQRALCHKEDDDCIIVQSFDIKPGCNPGENMISSLYCVTVQALINNENKTYDLMVKCFPQNPLRREWVLKADLFLKEIKFYTEILPEMIKFQKDLGKDPLIPSTPICYYTFTDNQNDAVVMENLKVQGYKTGEKVEGVDYEHCKLVMVELAKFHAISFAMKEQYPEPLLQTFPYLQGKLFCNEMKESIAFMEKWYAALTEAIRCIPNYSIYAARMEKFKGRVVDVIHELLQPQEPFSVICHGDAWFSNMLFSYEKQGELETPCSVKLIDLQTICYAPPTTDLAYFFYQSTTTHLRRNHLDDLLKLYHVSFLSYIKHMDTQAPDYTFQKLKSDFYSSIPLGYVIAAVFLTSMLSAPANIPDMEKITKEEMEELGKSFPDSLSDDKSQNPLIRDRIFELIEEMAELGVI